MTARRRVVDGRNGRSAEGLGGKGANLVRLAALGFRVPPFVVVTTTAMTEALEQAGIAKGIRSSLDALAAGEADAKEVSDWLRDRTALAVSMPNVDSATGVLLGGRKCKINGAPAAFAMYRVGDETASVVALRESDQALAHMKRVDRNGDTHWVDRCRGHTVVACRRGELIYAAVSRLAEEALFPLMPPLAVEVD